MSDKKTVKLADGLFIIGYSLMTYTNFGKSLTKVSCFIMI